MSTDTYQELRSSVLRLLEEREIDPDVDRPAAEAAVADAVVNYQRIAEVGGGRPLHDPPGMRSRLIRSIAEYGPLTDVLTDPGVEEIFIEGSRVTYIGGGGRLSSVDEPTSLDENRHVVDRLLAGTDRRLDAASPIVQARVLGDTARLTAVIPPVSDQLSVTIRRYALRNETLASLVELGSITAPAALFLDAVVRAGASVVVSGPPGAGKTSLLSALLHAVPSTDCVRCCEEVRELHVPLVHGSYYEARPPGLDGSGTVDLRQLVKVVLAMRPDRIVVGEVRGAEAFELTRAVNAGCGFACTVHANSARDALHALVNAALMAGENVPESVVRKVFASSIDVVVHLERDAPSAGDAPVRQVTEILTLVPSLHDDFSTQPIFARDGVTAPLLWTGARPHQDLMRRLARIGADPTDLLDTRVPA